MLTSASSAGPIRAALLGNGDSARFLMLPAAARIAQLRIEAICARERQALHDTATRWGIGLQFDDCFRALDLVRPDLAIVALPPPLQLGVLETAVSRSMHVLLEKPAAVSEDAAARMAELARDTELHLTVNLPLRFHPAFVRLAAVLRAEIVAQEWPKLHFRYLVSPPRQPWYHDPAQSGGAALMIGIHPIDFLLEALPQRPTRLQVRRIATDVAEFRLLERDLLLAEGTAGWSDTAQGIEFALPDHEIMFRFGPGDRWTLFRPGRPVRRGQAFAGFASRSSLHDIVRRIENKPASATNDLRQHVDLLLPLIRATSNLKEEWREVYLPLKRSENG